MTPRLQTFDGRQQTVLDDPGQIQPGDWLPDLGTLRQVKSVETIDITTGSSGVVHILHFVPQRGVQDLPRGISGSTREVTVWRTPHRDTRTPARPRERTRTANLRRAEEAPRDSVHGTSSQPTHQDPPADVPPLTRTTSAGDPPTSAGTPCTPTLSARRRCPLS